jgi:hypothetical protein
MTKKHPSGTFLFSRWWPHHHPKAQDLLSRSSFCNDSVNRSYTEKMSVSKRRLSSGSGLLSLCADDDSDDDDLSVTLQEKSIYTFPKKANSRRRSSFGGANSSKNPINAVEQARIAEMYKTVIQMSSENVRSFASECCSVHV